MLGALGGVSLLAMLLTVRRSVLFPAVIWAVYVALAVVYEFGVPLS